MTKRLRWPNTAEHARQAALGDANRGLIALSTVIHGKCAGRSEEMRQVAIANDCLHRIRFELEAVGPGKEKTQAEGGSRGFLQEVAQATRKL
ncbi:hypothetical protein ADN00_18790 [Ornatilinea apprima]|uniref:Four helix bundle protein n=1 Tax=Ornatilinea apprima TaxID=1134406 RepID=A0A0P6XME2_9CHLR|nr:hypothetical protein ADN00_18790 [Ornatilinea apprima]